MLLFVWIGRVRTIEKTGMCSGLVDHLGAIVGRMACILAAALLACASSAHAQVIEEGGFPVKGNGVSGEPFSLSCPPRLVVGAGESVLLSCSATAVPEEGVRYEWESLSGDGLRLLSASDELPPLFTAPLSGESAEYAYRLTAMSVGVYETATVTVIVGGVSGESVGAPVVLEECDPFAVPEGLGEGCTEDKGPAPFGFDPESEGGFLFPEAPGLPDRPSGPVRGGGSALQTPPYLDCPSAVFLEELETGAIECHAWDASGEEYLEYSWEPVGSTTRDYMDNPRLIPEDAPNPLVVAPEAPVYETLESFHSGERTFRYRYRLTATSRATGLSSLSEVEVYVSGSRPSVYCPLEVVVEESETVALDCEGVDPLSHRTDYDEDGASIEWAWEGLWGTSMAPLAAPDLSSPVFEAPPGSVGKRYHYIASMTSSASGMPRTARRKVTVTVLGADSADPVVTCNDSEVYEATDDFLLDCTVTDEPSGATYSWTGTDISNRLSSTTVLKPRFSVPGNVNGNRDYEYTVTLSADGFADVTGNVTVTVIEKPDISCITDHGTVVTKVGHTIPVDVSSKRLDSRYGCTFIGAPPGSNYEFNWVPNYIAGALPGPLSLLSETNVLEPVFSVPDDLDMSNRRFVYDLIISAENADPGRVQQGVTVSAYNLNVSCERRYYAVDEGAENFPFSCSASGGPSNLDYMYSWRGTWSADHVNLLSDPSEASPGFIVPENVPQDMNYFFTLWVTINHPRSRGASVNVRVLVRDTDVQLRCKDRISVYEGSGDITLDCSVTGAPDGATYSWTARGGTPDTRLLSGTTVLQPTFAVPDNVDSRNAYYDYRVGLSVNGVEQASDEVRIWVLNKEPLVIICQDHRIEVSEGDPDFDFDCSASGAPSGSEYAWLWFPADRLTDHDTSTPTFSVPGDVEQHTTWSYTVVAAAHNAEDGAATVFVRVLDTGTAVQSPIVTCNDSSAYEGSGDITLDCSVTGAPDGATYSWTARGDTPDTRLLRETTVLQPTFTVPDNVDSRNAYYDYRVGLSVNGVEQASDEVRIWVLNKEPLVIICRDHRIEVSEGDPDFDFDCSASGAPSGSEYAWLWSPADRLTDHDTSTPTFSVPGDVEQNTTWAYTVTATAMHAEDGTERVTVTVRDTDVAAPNLVCVDPDEVYEGWADFDLRCSVRNEPSNASYRWSGTDVADRLRGGGLTPTFLVPDDVDSDTEYEYTVRLSANGIDDATEDITVRVLNRSALSVVCTSPGSVYEGSADIALDCAASGAPGDNPQYTYAWTARRDTPDVSLLSAADIASPTFHVPDEVDEDETYEYLLTVSADNAEEATAEVSVTVLNKKALAVVCSDPGTVYEGSEDIAFDCSASRALGNNPEYTYVWTARGDAQDVSLLSAADIASPVFFVPDEVDEDETYEYLLTVSANNAEEATAEVSVTVLNERALAVVCSDPGTMYEGSEDIAFDCSASGAPGNNPEYTYVWTARGDTPDVSLLSAADIATPTFHVPDEVDEDETYGYLLTVSADNAEEATAEVSVTVLNKSALAVVCTNPGSVYEGSEDIALDCSASGAPGNNPEYTYAWTPRGDTPDVSLLSAADIASPVFFVPDEVDEDETYGYLLTVSADNAEEATAEVSVTVLNKSALAVVCTNPGSVYEGSEDIALDCSASGAPGNNPEYTYAWTPRGDTPDVSLLSAADIASPVFFVPDEVDEDETYEYLLTVSAANAEEATAEISVTVLDTAQTPPSDPVSLPLASSSSTRESSSTALGVTVSASPLRFGVQSAATEVSLDPMTDQISTYVSGPYHGGRMTLSLDGSEPLDGNGEMDLSIELASPVVLRREGGVEAASIILAPNWSLAESCEQLSSQAIRGLYTEVTLSEDACRLLRFGGELDLTDVLSGQYTGSLDIILRSGESEETHTVDVEVTVIPAQRVITIGPGGVRFSTSRELPAGLTEEQNLSIYPDVAFLTEEKPHGVFELSNPSLIPLEISVSARFGYTEATENGREVVVEDVSESHLGDLSQVVDIHPGVLVLMPGEKGLVRYGMQEGALATMADKGYAAFFDVVSEPRQYVRLDQMPEEVSGEKTARVTMRVPGVYVPGEGASQLRATLLSISFVDPMSATFLLETQDHPFVGEVLAYDGEGRELGRRETLVYTRSRVRVPLDRLPEEDVVFLRFAPRGSGRVPEPASVEWDAPRRDIGAAEDKDRATTTETLVQKP